MNYGPSESGEGRVLSHSIPRVEHYNEAWRSKAMVPDIAALVFSGTKVCILMVAIHVYHIRYPDHTNQLHNITMILLVGEVFYHSSYQFYSILFIGFSCSFAVLLYTGISPLTLVTNITADPYG